MVDLKETFQVTAREGCMDQLWPSDVVSLQQKEGEDDTKEIKKPAPWSSRSSPSGTFVRDPKTGKMVNIDE